MTHHVMESTPAAALKPHLLYGLFLILLIVNIAAPVVIHGSVFAILHDSMDSEAVYNVVIGRFWAGGADPAVFDVFLGGSLEWWNFARIFQPLILVYAIFPPEIAYAVEKAIVMSICFYGVIELCKALDLINRGVLAFLAAFSISYTVHGLGYAGFPLILALVFRKDKPSPIEMAIAAFIGLNTSLPLHGIFVPPAILLSILMLGIRPNVTRLFVTTGLFALGSILSAAGLLASVFSGVPTHRESWNIAAPDSYLPELLKDVVGNFLFMTDAYHSIIVPLSYSSVILVIAIVHGGLARRAALVLAASIVIFTAMEIMTPEIFSLISPSLNTIQYHRVVLFFPILLLVVAGLIVPKGIWILAYRGGLIVFVALFFILNVGLTLSRHPNLSISALKRDLLAGNTLKAVGDTFNPHDLAQSIPTWKAHFKPDAYACLKSSLEQEPEVYRVVSFGPDPMIAPFHRIPAIDGYHNYYPLSYKLAFRRVITDLLKSSPDAQKYFDDWGNRVYTSFDLEDPILPNIPAAYDLGATHLISDKALKSQYLIKTVQCDGLFLYKIN